MVWAVRFFLLICCCFLWIGSYPQTIISRETLPSPSIASLNLFGLSEGLPINCLEKVILDSKGRLWLNPCFHNTTKRGLNFFQYDGEKSIYFDFQPDGSREKEAFSWYARGETSQGFLFGKEYLQSIVFFWHPDTRQQHFFYFEESEQILNIEAEPEGTVLVLVLHEHTYRIYRLAREGKQVLGEITLEFKEALNYNYPHPLVLINHQILFLHQTDGLVSLDLNQNTMQFKSWEELTGDQPMQRYIYDIMGGALSWQMVSYAKNSVFLYLGMKNGFFSLDLSTFQLTPHQVFNPVFFSHPILDNLQVRLTQDQKNNILINLGYHYEFAAKKKNTRDYAYLIDHRGQIHNYSLLVEKISNSAEYEGIPSWDGHYFSHDFQRQLGWSSLGGMVLVELQLEFDIQAFSLNKGTRAIAFLDSLNLMVNTDGPSLILNLKDGSYDFFQPPDSSLRILTSVQQTKDQHLWMTNRLGTLHRYDLVKKEPDIFPIGLDFEKFIFINETEVALFSMEGQFFIYDIKTRTKRPYFIEGVPFSVNSVVKDLLLESDSLLWVATQRGLWSVDLLNHQSKHFDQVDILKDANIMCINQGKNRELWLGTAQDGVLIFSPGSQKISQIAKLNGLSHNTVAGILTDNSFNRWVSTFDGLTVISPEEEVLFEIREENGLTHNEFNITSYKKLPDGKLAFGGIKGINILNPNEILREYIQNESPKIFLTEIEFFDKKTNKDQVYKGSFRQQGSLQIPAANRYLTLDFAISDYIEFAQHTYSYRILPLKSTKNIDNTNPWTNLGPVSELSLNNLPVGDWLVQIRGVDHKGNKVEFPLEIPIHVDDFFYNKWWFYVLCALPFLFGGWIWIQRILTERKRLKIEVEKRTEQIRQDKEIIAKQVEELQQVDEVKSRFFTNISHELRTPLTIISGMSNKIYQNPDQWVTQGTKMISRNADELLNLVNQILDLRKLEAGKLKPELIHGDIIPFINYIFESFHSMGEGKEIQLKFLSESDELFMDHDPKMILRIVSNLLSNAIKYSNTGGKVTLKLETVSNHESLDVGTPESLKIMVQDEGLGIPEDQLPYIFDRFYQVDDSSTRKGEGTGIGLSLIRELIKLLNGRIEVESRVGEGSSFFVYLPIHHQSPKASESPQLKVLLPNSTREEEILATTDNMDTGIDLPNLLIIEDNSDVRQYLTICLEGHYTLSYAVNGEVGIEKALEEVPDIIISDVMMPKKDGYEVCDTLKKDVRTSHIPIIMLTAKSDADSRISGLEVGADAYLSKPFNELELFVRLEKLLEIRKTLQNRYKSMDTLAISESHPNKQEDAFILEVQDIIQQNLSDETFGIAELCRSIGMSRTQLHNKLKSLTGRSTSHYIRSIRIHKAKDMLANDPSLNITDIAFEVGFSNLKYFSKVFSEEIGNSPSNYRKNLHSEQ